MNCPNCGENEKLEKAMACSNCGMPLAGIADQVREYREKTPGKQREEESSFNKQRLIGAAAFLAIAAIPIGMGVKNSIQTEAPPDRQLTA